MWEYPPVSLLGIRTLLSSHACVSVIVHTGGMMSSQEVSLSVIALSISISAHAVIPHPTYGNLALVAIYACNVSTESVQYHVRLPRGFPASAHSGATQIWRDPQPHSAALIASAFQCRGTRAEVCGKTELYRQSRKSITKSASGCAIGTGSLFYFSAPDRSRPDGVGQNPASTA